MVTLIIDNNPSMIYKFQDINTFLSAAKHGVIYFSMGSMIRAETFPEMKRDAFLEVFSKLPQTVLWKWEGDVLPNQPSNVFIRKWLPQHDVLCHPNIRVFVTHGGMLSTMEAVNCGVPMVGIPMYGDQPTNVGAVVAAGAGVLVEYNNISKQSLLEALKSVLEDSSYRHNAQRISRSFNDRPAPPLDTAVYWTEYVIKHKGAPHMRSAAVHVPWFQYYLLDVITVLLLIASVVIFVILALLKTFISFIGR